jgi:CheY-like chemotaxis protein
MKKNIIWIVDDDFIYQTIVKKLIQKTGVFSAYTSFTNGKEAINTLINNLEDDVNYLPDIILLDINMPVMDGWEFMGEFKKLKNNLTNQNKIYIVSSSIAVEDRNKSKSFTDIIGYIAKPITINEMLSIVNNE